MPDGRRWVVLTRCLCTCLFYLKQMTAKYPLPIRDDKGDRERVSPRGVPAGWAAPRSPRHRLPSHGRSPCVRHNWSHQQPWGTGCHGPSRCPECPCPGRPARLCSFPGRCCPARHSRALTGERVQGWVPFSRAQGQHQRPGTARRNPAPRGAAPACVPAPAGLSRAESWQSIAGGQAPRCCCRCDGSREQCQGRGWRLLPCGGTCRAGPAGAQGCSPGQD